MSSQSVLRPGSLCNTAAIGLLIERAVQSSAGPRTCTPRAQLPYILRVTSRSAAGYVDRRLRPWLSSRSRVSGSGTTATIRTYAAQACLAQELQARLSSDQSIGHDSFQEAPHAHIQIFRDELRSIIDEAPNLPIPQRRACMTAHATVDFFEQNERGSDRPCPHPPRISREPDAATRSTVDRIRGLLQQSHPDLEVLDATYQALPEPRLAYLKTPTIHKLCRAFRQVERKSETSMLRYFALLDAMAEIKLPLKRHEWNASTAFAAEWASDAIKAKSSIQILTKMESTGVYAATVTFNILFHTAARAGRFSLGELILAEMQRRNIKADYITQTNRIYYYGLRKDGDRIRKVYREMVDNGDVIDTVVLNCVIVSLIRAGEATAAEQVLKRMIQLSRRSFMGIIMPQTWRNKRRYRYLFQKAHRYTAESTEKRQFLQQKISVAPNVHTYRAIIRHHSRDSANIDRIMIHLRDMQDSGMNCHGSIFWHIFAGFDRHGGVRFSSWTRTRLDEIWSQFVYELNETANTPRSTPDHVLGKDERPCRLNPSIVVALLKAYARCSDIATVTKRRHELSRRWEPDEETERAMDAAMYKIWMSR